MVYFKKSYLRKTPLKLTNTYSCYRIGPISVVSFESLPKSKYTHTSEELVLLDADN